VKPLQPTITVNVGRIEDTKPLDVTCRTTGSRPKATLECFVSSILPTFTVMVGWSGFTEIIYKCYY
jgi:hypothetical protein